MNVNFSEEHPLMAKKGGRKKFGNDQKRYVCWSDRYSHAPRVASSGVNTIFIHFRRCNHENKEEF